MGRIYNRIRKLLREWLSYNDRCSTCGDRAGSNPDCPECLDLEDFRQKNSF